VVKLDLKPLTISEQQNEQSQQNQRELLQELLDQDIGGKLLKLLLI